VNVPLFLVDSFTDVPFKGNPAGVCLLDGPATNTWMQNVAMEMNQAETAFLFPQDSDYSLRWFTPNSEVDLCGHATLASAHVLWETGWLSENSEATFNTKSGTLTCKKQGNRIEMDFPAEPAEAVDFPERLLEKFEAHPVWFGRNRMDYLIELISEKDVIDLVVDLPALAKIDCRGFIFTAKASSSNCDFVSRFFAPAFGVPEDPVTGSAHCCLGPYWAEKLGKNEMIGYQASKRGGFVGVEVKGDRVALKGNAVTVFNTEICLP
jgi:PhzF family phenazine biosynthesis protein